MGSDQEKAEKKRLKAQYKLEKKRAQHEDKIGSKKTTSTADIPESPKLETEEPTYSHQTKQEQVPPTVQQDLPWYKDPIWLRALAAIVTMIVAIIALYLQFVR